MLDDHVVLQLSSDEAVVLFELLSRFDENDVLDIQHGGERAALWRLHGALEKKLVEPFRRDYDELLSAARERLAERYGT